MTGGTFTKSGNNNSQFCVEVDEDNASNPGSIAVSCGNFTKAVPEQYCAFGKMPSPVDPGTGMYTVIPGIVYPTGAYSVGVQMPVSWIKDNTDLVAGEESPAIIVSGDRAASLGVGIGLLADLKALGVGHVSFQVSGADGK